MMKSDSDPTAEVVAAVMALEESEDFQKDEIALSSGLRLRLKTVPKHFIYGVTKDIPAPDVPLVYVDGKKRPIENPDDPDYKEALDKWIVVTANAATDVALLRGTEILDLPDGMISPDSTEWVEELEVLGLPMRDNSRARYLYWIKAVGVPEEEDLMALMEALGRLTGVTEDDVADAVERFRGIAERPSDT
jgi:hypothetical protein